jgi:hypothetical protein
MVNAPFAIFLFLHISPYTVAEIYERNTGPCITEKYGRIWSVYGMYTTVYGVPNSRSGQCEINISFRLDMSYYVIKRIINVQMVE